MNIAVGIGCLVVVTLQSAVNGFSEEPELKEYQSELLRSGGSKRGCKILGGDCQDINDPCDGVLRTGRLFCFQPARYGCCVPNGCVFGETAYANGALIQDTCMILQCHDGTWNYIDIDKNCGFCDVFGDPHIISFDNHTTFSNNEFGVVGKNDTSYTITQPGIGNNPEFGVNSTFVRCPLLSKPHILTVTCIGSVTYYQPGIEIILTVADPYIHDCSDSNDPRCQIQVSVNGQNLIIGTSVELIYGTTGTALIFQYLDPTQNIYPYYYAIYCINIVGSEGLSVFLCVEDGNYPQLYVSATKSLQENPPNYSSGLFGLCDTWTGTDRNTFILRNGSTVPTTDKELFIDSWIIPDN